MKFFRNTIKIKQEGYMKPKMMISQIDLGYLKLLIDLVALIDENREENKNIEKEDLSKLILN
jgi:hypothetical protein